MSRLIILINLIIYVIVGESFFEWRIEIDGMKE